MAFNIIESARNLIQRVRTDIQRNLEGSNPYLKNSFLGAISIAIGNRFYDLYRLVDYWKNQFFVNTADDENLSIFAELKDVERGVSSQSQGPIVITGDEGEILDVNSAYTFGSLRFFTQETVTIETTQLSVLSITQVNGLATVTTTSEHRLASNVEVIISGANESDYNGTFQIAVISATQFTYAISLTAPSSASGTIISEFTTAYVNVKSEDNGSGTNVDSGAELRIEVNQSGIDSSAYVAFGGIAGGTDDQTTEEWREDIIDAWANPLAQFNDQAIIRQCKTITGVTRVWVKRITPAVGQVTVYFTRDNDEDSIIPSASEVATVKERLDLIVPMNTDLDDVFVLALTEVSTDFTLTNIVPDSNSMRTAIRASLSEFFRTGTEEGTDVARENYESAILATYDLETGLKLESFELISPTGDITVSSGEIATLGQVLFT